MPIKIFLCYARKDGTLLKALQQGHLKSLERRGLIDVWYDRDIGVGKEWKQEIKDHLNAAQIILLLISPDFMASEYCYSVEMKQAIERHKRGEACIIPIILRPVHWQEEPLNMLQALPTDARPVTNWPRLDDALFDVASGIRKVIKEQWWKESNTYYNTGSYEEALQAITQAIKLDAKDAKLYKLKGDILYKLKMFEGSLAAYEQTILTDPKDVSAYNNKGMLLNELGRYNDALNTCMQALDVDSRNALSFHIKGQALQKLKYYQYALEAYEQAISIDSHRAETHECKGQVLEQLDRYPEAVLAYRQAIEIDSANPHLYHAQGIILRKLNRNEDALATFEHAILLDPNNAHFQKEKAITLQRLKPVDREEAHSLPALPEQPSTPVQVSQAIPLSTPRTSKLLEHILKLLSPLTSWRAHQQALTRKPGANPTRHSGARVPRPAGGHPASQTIHQPTDPKHALGISTRQAATRAGVPTPPLKRQVLGAVSSRSYQLEQSREVKQNRHGISIVTIISVIIIIIVFVISSIAYSTFQSSDTATATIAPPLEGVSAIFNLTANPNQTNADINVGIIPLQTLSSTQSISQSGNTTGQGDCTAFIDPPFLRCKQAVSQQDVNNLMNQALPGVQLQIANDLHQQEQAQGETSVGKVVYPDNPTVTANPPVGTVSNTVTVTVSLNGTQTSIRTNDATAVARQKLQGQLKPNFSLVDKTIQIGQPIMQSTDAQGNIQIKIAAAAWSRYNLTSSDISDIQNHIAGKSQNNARAYIAQKLKLDLNAIRIKVSVGDTLPGSGSQITVTESDPSTLPPVQVPATPFLIQQT